MRRVQPLSRPLRERDSARVFDIGLHIWGDQYEGM